MYHNLLFVMKQKNVTSKQISEALECRPGTIGEKINGKTSSGFTFDEAIKTKRIFFPEYDLEFLFSRE